MDRALRSLSAPSGFIFRVSRTYDPFQPPDWQYVRPDGTFGNRFDDPRKNDGLDQTERFRTIYCALDREGAYGETTARLRRSLNLIASLELIEPEEPLDADEYSGVITFEWRLNRRLGMMRLFESLPFVDVTAPESLQTFRAEPALARVAEEGKFKDLDLSAVTGATGEHRRLTQAIAAFVHEQRDSLGQPRFAGIYYPSRLNPEWNLVAIFDDRLTENRVYTSHTIRAHDPALRWIAEFFDLTIE